MLSFNPAYLAFIKYNKLYFKMPVSCLNIKHPSILLPKL